MSKRHGAREQRKLAKQKAKRDQRRRQLARRDSPDPTVRLAAADRWPVTAALVSEQIWESGIGQAIIARRTPQGLIATGLFLVDVFCMGVKNAMWRIDGPDDYRKLIDQIDERGPLKRVTPEYVSKLVHCAADYAQALGIAPHPDFRHARMLLEGIDPSQCPDELQFGQDGKPFYMPGPHEQPHRVREIIERVTAAGGHYIAEVGHDALDLDELDLDQLDLQEIESDDADAEAADDSADPADGTQNA